MWGYLSWVRAVKVFLLTRRKVGGRGQSKATECAQEEKGFKGGADKCDEVLGGDYWAETLRIEPSFAGFFKLNRGVL